MLKENSIEVYESKDFRKWLKKNHIKENHVLVIIHKKHTGKNKTSAAELMKEAICFGWIDTTGKRIDNDRWSILYRKRSKNSTWSYNTLGYAKDLLKKGLMSEEGIKWYKEGLKKKPHDYGIPKNPEMPEELKKALEKNKKAKEIFEKFSPSVKRTYFRGLIRAKMPETKEKRVKSIIEQTLGKEKKQNLKEI
ncbi:MAG: YdeI/OmpD-associated family protein [Nanoarchaeota archaeon]|nr:YdeI/OmpD-associated family protein [Nanoarchaeota archaeon]